MSNVNWTIAKQIESTGNLVSGLGEYGLANRLWKLAGERRRIAEEEDNEGVVEEINIEAK